MNIYLLPIYDTYSAEPEIKVFKAKDISSAEEKVIKYYQDKFNIEEDLDWEGLYYYLCENKALILGQLYDIEEFEDRVGY